MAASRVVHAAVSPVVTSPPLDHPGATCLPQPQTSIGLNPFLPRGARAYHSIQGSRLAAFPSLTPHHRTKSSVGQCSPRRNTGKTKKKKKSLTSRTWQMFLGAPTFVIRPPLQSGGRLLSPFAEEASLSLDSVQIRNQPLDGGLHAKHETLTKARLCQKAQLRLTARGHGKLTRVPKRAVEFFHGSFSDHR